jgi:hypothetical protein
VGSPRWNMELMSAQQQFQRCNMVIQTNIQPKKFIDVHLFSQNLMSLFHSYIPLCFFCLFALFFTLQLPWYMVFFSFFG